MVVDLKEIKPDDMVLGFTKFKPMLASKVDFAKLKFPLYATPKLDGIRCIVAESGLVSRSLKTIPNIHVQNWFADLPVGLDGELVYVDQHTGLIDFSKTTSVVTSKDNQMVTVDYRIEYHVFDYITPDLKEALYLERIEAMDEVLATVDNTIPVKSVGAPVRVSSVDALMDLHQQYLMDGFEGTMVRTKDSRYKFGRSTQNQGWLLKLKDFIDDEAVVTGFVERRHHVGESTIDALGHQKRDSKKDNFVGSGTLGALQVRMRYLKDAQEVEVDFEIGTGFDAITAQEIWDNQEFYMGKLVKFRYFEIASQGKPRFPSFKGFRHPDDMS
jgi:DNA ligase 1